MTSSSLSGGVDWGLVRPGGAAARTSEGVLVCRAPIASGLDLPEMVRRKRGSSAKTLVAALVGRLVGALPIVSRVSSAMD